MSTMSQPHFQPAKPYAPEEAVRVSGIYESFHAEGCKAQRRHAFVTGNVFPRCRKCNGWVQYQLLQAAPSAAEDPDFAASAPEKYGARPAKAARLGTSAPHPIALRPRQAK